MYLSYAMEYIPVVDEINNYQLYLGMHPEDHMVQHIYS